jgi:diacylglycerol O-acyltransferase
MVDGISGVKLQEILLEKAGGAAPPPAPIAHDGVDREPSGLELVLDAWCGLARDGSGVVRRALGGLRHPVRASLAVRDTALGLGFFARRLLGVRSGPIQGTIGPRRVYAHAAASIADVQTIRKALGGSLNDVVLAAVSGAYRTLLLHRGIDADRAHLRTLVPVSVRGPDDGVGAHNRVSAILCDLPLDVASPVQRLRAVRERMDALKASHMADAGAFILEIGDLAPPMIVGPITRLVARAMHAVPQRLVGTVTTNVPGPREPLYLLGRKLVEWYPYVPITQGLRLGTAILSYEGRLGFGVTGDWATAPDVAVVARAIEAEIEGLKRIATPTSTAARGA